MNTETNQENPMHPGIKLQPKGYFPTALSSLVCGWEVKRETEKAVMIEDSDGKGSWFPRSQVIVEAGRIVAVKQGWYNKITRTATKLGGF